MPSAESCPLPGACGFNGATDSPLQDDGTTALMLAAQNGHAAVVTVLLKQGADPNQANFIDGGTALTAGAYCAVTVL